MEKVYKAIRYDSDQSWEISIHKSYQGALKSLSTERVKVISEIKNIIETGLKFYEIHNIPTAQRTRELNSYNNWIRDFESARINDWSNDYATLIIEEVKLED